MNVPFTEEGRRRLLERYAEVLMRKEDLELRELQDPVSEDPSFDDEITAIIAINEDISRKYLDGLPKIPISRCPFSGETVVHSLDIFGIDGLWWSFEAPLRPIEALPESFHTLSGALKISEPVEKTSFIVRPGPEVPFVVPGLLANPSVVAVLSSVPIGPHQGYVICYYSSDPESVDFYINTWGASERLEGLGVTPRGWSTRELGMEEMDFNLEPWIKSGKLGWISPSDFSFTIRTTLEDCPYLELEGEKKPRTIFGGRVV